MTSQNFVEPPFPVQHSHCVGLTERQVREFGTIIIIVELIGVT